MELVNINLIKLIKQFIRFGLVGVLNTAITWIVILLCTKVLILPYYISNPSGYLLGFINSFVMNKFWTFGSKGSAKTELFVFTGIFIVNYFLQLGFTAFLIQVLKINELLSQGIAAVPYIILGFVLNKYFAFKNSK